MSAAIVASPFSLVAGSIVKGFAYISQGVRGRHDEFIAWRVSPEVHSNNDRYRALGMAVDEILEPVEQQYHQRRPGDAHYRWCCAGMRVLRRRPNIRRISAAGAWLVPVEMHNNALRL